MSTNPSGRSAEDSAETNKKTQEQSQFSIVLDNVRDYEFRVKFDKQQYESLLMDEPAPLGGDSAPNASRFVAAAVGNCLSASFLFCLRKSRVNIQGIHTEVKLHQIRNEEGKVRIGKIEVEISPDIKDPDPRKVERCLGLFEDYCIVT